ncbi:MAG: glycosyltransferase family 39 protein [Candidatus Daviesbacteria bacterium]|nr:glycosyltransferase family 39 protein [Candidatus Daviesbacteria bacterium]
MLILLSIFILHLIILSQLTFTAWPEMLSYPYLLSNGFSLYKDLVAPYTPVLILLETLFFKLFGFSPEVLKILTWILILLADLLMYLILRNFTQSKILIGIFLSIFITLQSFFDGNMLWFDFASEIPLLASLLFIQIWLKKGQARNLFMVGFFLGLAFLVKQIALIYFPVFAVVYLYHRRKIIAGELVNFVSGAVVAVLPFLLYLIVSSSLIDFWLWSVYYPVTFWSQFPGYTDFNLSTARLKISLLLLLPLIPILFFHRKVISNKTLVFTCAFFVTSLIAVYPRFSFFHLQPPIAFLVLLFAQIFSMLSSSPKKIYLILIIAISLSLVSLIFKNEVGNGIRFYGEEEKQLAEIIKQKTKPDEKIWLQGPISLEYVLAGRQPSKPWLDNFGWYLEIPGVQEEIISGMEEDQTKFVFWQVPQPGNWYAIGTYQPKQVTDFIRNNFNKVEVLGSGIEIWQKKD